MTSAIRNVWQLVNVSLKNVETLVQEVLERKHCFLEPVTKPYSYNTACLLKFSHNCNFIWLGTKTFVAACVRDVCAQISWDKHLKCFRGDACNHDSLSYNISSEGTHHVRCRFFVTQRTRWKFFSPSIYCRFRGNLNTGKASSKFATALFFLKRIFMLVSVINALCYSALNIDDQQKLTYVARSVSRQNVLKSP